MILVMFFQYFVFRYSFMQIAVQETRCDGQTEESDGPSLSFQITGHQKIMKDNCDHHTQLSNT